MVWSSISKSCKFEPAVAGGLRDEDYSGLWDLVVVDGLLSSFAEAHSVLLSEPTHMEDEDEDEDQENEKEDESDGEECKMESRRESK